MFLYHMNLQRPSGINVAVVGNFSGSKQQEIVVARTNVLELLRLDPATSKLTVVYSQDVFSNVRSLAAFRLTGESRDYIVVGSDSGKIIILEYKPDKNYFHRVHAETYGKTGARRIVPGQYLACDPHGRAAMVAAVEKQKLVYILNRDSTATLTISSPLEAHKSFTICFDIVGVDVGYDNPIFACLELDYEEADRDPSGAAVDVAEKQLTYYELDLGLNNVVRKWSEAVPARSNKLIAVPGGTDGPSGVLVCAEGIITWRNQNYKPVTVPIPRRRHPLQNRERDPIIVQSTLVKTRQRFFYLLQSEEGDIFKLTVVFEKDVVQELRIKYFDSVPLASHLAFLRAGFLFVAPEFGNQMVYQIVGLGDNDDETEFSSAQFPDATTAVAPFDARATPQNLALVDESDSLSPVLDAKVLDMIGEDTPQVYALCGRGTRSTFRIMRYGLEVTPLMATELPAHPIAVWTVKQRLNDEHDAFMLVSFINATLVLSIGETVEEVTNSGFVGNKPTLSVSQLGDDAMLQVYAEGIRHIRADRRVNEWKAPTGRPIVRAAANERQVVIALAGGELVYFELDATGQLNEFQDRRELHSEVVSLALGPVPEGRQRSRFMAVGCVDNTVRVLSLDPEDCLQVISIQALPAHAESLCITDLPDQEGTGALYLFIGLVNGVLVRAVLDGVNGQLSDTRTRFLGARPVKLFRVHANGGNAVLALSARPWLAYAFQKRSMLTPLSCNMLEYASKFSSAQCPEGIVAVSQNMLRIMTVEKLGQSFNQTSIPLRYTPRKMVLHAPSRTFAIIEADRRAYPLAARQAAADAAKASEPEDMETDEKPTEPAAEAAAPKVTPENDPVFPYASDDAWASCVRLLDPQRGQTISCLELDPNECATCIAYCTFHDQQGEVHLVVGSALKLTLAPRTCEAGFLRVYRVTYEGLQLVHKTQLEDAPTALCQFQGRLLAGMGRTLRIYDLGKKKLLRKCENKNFYNMIISLQTQGDRIIVGDVQESITYAKYKAVDNQLVIFADDTVSRWLTSSVMLDYDTVAGGDKFGNFFVNRLPSEVSDEVDDDPAFSRVMLERGFLNGAPHKVRSEVEFYVGDTLTSVHRAVMVPGGSEVIVYTTLTGGLGAFVPFLSKDDVIFMQHLEMHMRTEDPPLLGRDHMSYRSYYFPVKGVVDGVLCERFARLPSERKRAIADELDRSVADILKKLEDMQNRVAF